MVVPPTGSGGGVLLEGWHSEVSNHGKLLEILRCLANTDEQSALPASRYSYRIHVGGSLSSPTD